MHYDIEADYFPLTTCNFRCSYCFIKPHLLGAKLPHFGTNEEWEDGFNATGKTWLLHITGGEPFVYPKFVDLCQRLTKRHYLSINSNLTHRSVDEFAAVVDPARVHFINAAVHLEERRKRSGLDAFVQKALKLKNAGFSIMASLVITPELVDEYPQISADFESHGLPLVPKTLRGKYKGTRYPRSYSPEHVARIKTYLAESGRRNADMLTRMGEAPTIDIFSDERFLEGDSDYKGKLCGSGYNFVLVRPEGTVVRCGTTEVLGNILQKTLKLLDRPRVCDTTYCPYFCEKYTSPAYLDGYTLEDVQPTPAHRLAAIGIRSA